jgi:hypothetical protein
MEYIKSGFGVFSRAHKVVVHGDFVWCWLTRDVTLGWLRGVKSGREGKGARRAGGMG